MNIKTLNLLLLLSIIGTANGATVSRIDITGNQRMDDESVRILADVKPGNDVNSEHVNNIAKTLQSSGYFEKVDVKLNGNVLKINVVESPIINMVTVEGNDEIDTEDLKKEIKTKERTSYDKSVIGGDVQRMLTLYQRKGFFGTKINPKKIDLDNNRVNVVYEIKEEVCSNENNEWTDIGFEYSASLLETDKVMAIKCLKKSNNLRESYEKHVLIGNHDTQSLTAPRAPVAQIADSSDVEDSYDDAELGF